MNLKSVSLSANPACRQTGVTQTSYDIVKAHRGVPMAIGMKVETKEARPDDPVGRGEGSEFSIQLPKA